MERNNAAQLEEAVNFAGHYRIYLSWNGELPKECGNACWVCDWILDKNTGKVISPLPEFNGNTAYFTYNDNGTPCPESFFPVYYADSTMLWTAGSNVPAKGDSEGKCAIITYNFKDDKFILLFCGECVVDHGSDPDYLKQHQLWLNYLNGPRVDLKCCPYTSGVNINYSTIDQTANAMNFVA